MSVAVKLFDNDHKKQAILISDLHDAVLAGGDKQSLMKTFDALVKLVRLHFAQEEQFFAQSTYPDAAIHKQEHDNLMERINELQKRFRFETDMAGHLEVLGLLKGWLFSHIQSSDQDYARHFKATTVDSFPAAADRPFLHIRPAKTCIAQQLGSA
jgi:hemerythrin-like metal-binding protein